MLTCDTTSPLPAAETPYKGHPNPTTDDPLRGAQARPVAGGFWDHLEALRGTVIRSAVALFLGCCTAACGFPYCARWMNAPLRWACQHQPALLQGLVTTSPMGVFSVLVQICLLGGLALSLPYIVYQWMAFVAPALTRNEKRRLLPLGLAAVGLFLLGCSFSYAYVLPASLMFAMELNRTFGFELIWSAPHYYGLVVWMTLGIGLCFEFPLVILGLMYTGLVRVSTFKKIRRHMLLAILVVGAAIIPGGDPLSLILLAVPMYASYELMLAIGIKLEKKRSVP